MLGVVERRDRFLQRSQYKVRSRSLRKLWLFGKFGSAKCVSGMLGFKTITTSTAPDDNSVGISRCKFPDASIIVANFNTFIF
ncbi:MAG: hypothetical protein ACFCUV_00350 [Rivularia sp. (in: cyanobacteria)]